MSAYNPYWQLFDRSADRRTATPGRTSKIAIIGHSMGAAAVSKVQGTDRRVAAVVALDKLTGPGASGPLDGRQQAGRARRWRCSRSTASPSRRTSPAAAPRSPRSPRPDGPDPKRERATGYDAWRRAGVDSMLVVPRASTHLEYTDIPLVLPASRYGQDLSSHYVQAWLDRYLKHQSNDTALTGSTFRYLEPARQRGLGADHAAARLAAELLLLLGLRLPLRLPGAQQRRHRAASAAAALTLDWLWSESPARGRIGHGRHRTHRLGAEFFLDTRGDARSLRVRWHHDDGLVLLSLWRGAECTGTFRLAIDEVPVLIEASARPRRGVRATLARRVERSRSTTEVATTR